MWGLGWHLVQSPRGVYNRPLKGLGFGFLDGFYNAPLKGLGFKILGLGFRVASCSVATWLLK